MGLKAGTQERCFDSDFLVKILDLNSDCIVLLDTEGRMIYMNKGGREQMEMEDPEDYFHKPWVQLWLPSKKKEIESCFQMAMAGHPSQFRDFCATMRANPKWWEVNVHPLCDESGTPLFVLVISHDITRQKLLEDNLIIMSENKEALLQASRREMKDLHDQLIEKHLALEKTQTLLQMVINNSSELILVFDRNLNYTLVNQSASAFMELSAEEITGRNILDIYPGVVASGLYKNLLKCLSGETIHQPRFESYNKPGVFLDARFQPIIENDRVAGAYVMAKNLN